MNQYSFFWISGVLVVALLVGGLYLIYSTGRWGVEQPKYEVLGREGKFEMRRYPDLYWAETPMENEMGDSFRRLFRFITGENQSAEKIPMTSPVWIQKRDQGSVMAFGMAERVVATKVPEPRSSEVKLIRVKGGVFAVYLGRFRKEEISLLEGDLKGELARMNKKFEGEPIYAFYDPPWIPQWLSRSEILFRISGFY